MLIFPHLPAGSNGGSDGLRIVTWADGTDEEIKAIVQAAQVGSIDLRNYWSVGEERPITIGAFNPFSGDESFIDSHQQEEATISLMQQGIYTTTDNKYIKNNKEVGFVVGLKNCLKDTKTALYTGTGKYYWGSSPFRNNYTSVIYNSFPSYLQDIILTVRVISGTYSSGIRTGGQNDVSNDKIFLAAYKEVASVETSTYSGTTNEWNALSTFDYYKITGNRIKKNGDTDSAVQWWLRSPNYDNSSTVCRINSQGGEDRGTYDGKYSYICPHFCI